MKSTFERVAEWNKRCNKEPLEVGTNEYWEALSNQIERIQEELNETRDAISNKDMEELLDGCCDLDVTVSGLNYLAGMDYSGAINRVLNNNDKKYTVDIVEAGEAADKYTLGGEECNIQSYYDGDIGEIFFSVHRTSDNKIMKLLNHPKVNLTSFIPAEFIKEV